MSEFASELGRWSRGRWWSWILSVLAGQVLLVIWFAERTPPPPRPALVRTSYRVLPEATTGERLAESLAVLDPTLFALANPRGFSGAAWLNPHPVEHRWLEWTNPPYWLPPAMAQLGAAFSQFVETNSSPAMSVAGTLASPTLKLSIVENLLATQSVLHVEGNLVARPLTPPLVLPAISHQDFLTNSVVQVAVNPAGRVFSHVLLISSGSDDADREALRLAKRARFQSLPKSEAGRAMNTPQLTWGTLHFHWVTVAPTNTAGAGP